MKRIIFAILVLWGSMLFAEKNVLVLHAYHHGLPWTDSISSGIIDTLETSEEKINIYFEYLDSKRQINSDFLEVTLQYFLLKHQSMDFDAIIASDNDALLFMNRFQNKIFPNIPVIFCGVNNFTPELISNLSQATGVKEVANYKETLLVANSLFPIKNKVMVVLDDTLTGHAIKEEVKQVEPFFKDKLQFFYFWDFNDTEIEAFKNEHRGQYMLYLLSYNRDKNDKFLSYDDSILSIKTLFGIDVPIFGSWDFFLDKGIVGGVITTGYNQGKMAAELALEVLNGENANNLPIKSNIHRDSVILDYNQLEYFSLNLEPKTSLHVSYINKPDNFFKRYKTTLLSLAIFICIVLIGLLFGELRKRERDRMRKEFQQSLNHEIELALLQEKAQTDPLTGLLNRAPLEKKLIMLVEQLRTEGKELCFMIMDIDHFKDINDTHGHLAGDYILQELAHCLKSYFRKRDDIFRYGGEEFVVLLPDISLEQALVSAQKLRELIEKHIFSFEEKVIRVTISIGLTMRKEEDSSLQKIIARADGAMYFAKRKGRNRVEVS